MRITGDKNNGITLVALVITIIILLILAGISIAQLTGNGLFEKAKLAKEKAENARIEEEAILADYENKITGTSREEKLFSVTELLSEPAIVTSTRTGGELDVNFLLEDSIENYEYLLFTFGFYKNQTLYTIQTMLISVDNIPLQNKDDYAGEHLLLNAQTGEDFSCAEASFKDPNTFNIGVAWVSNDIRQHFAVTSIKGIK